MKIKIPLPGSAINFANYPRLFGVGFCRFRCYYCYWNCLLDAFHHKGLCHIFVFRTGLTLMPHWYNAPKRLMLKLLKWSIFILNNDLIKKKNKQNMIGNHWELNPTTDHECIHQSFTWEMCIRLDRCLNVCIRVDHRFFCISRPKPPTLT